MIKLRKRTDITLNEKQRKQEREDNEKERLNIENIRRKAKGLELLTELKSDDNSSIHGTEDKGTEDKGIEDKDSESKGSVDINAEDKNDRNLAEQKEIDPLLFETGKILSDLMNLDEKTVAKQQQAQQQ
jgi:carboxyl-terminal processing protease